MSQHFFANTRFEAVSICGKKSSTRKPRSSETKEALEETKGEREPRISRDLPQKTAAVEREIEQQQQKAHTAFKVKTGHRDGWRAHRARASSSRCNLPSGPGNQWNGTKLYHVTPPPPASFSPSILPFCFYLAALFSFPFFL